MSPPHPQSPDAALALWLHSLPIPANTAASNAVSQPNKPLADLIIDGDVLWQVLATLDSDFFRASKPSSISGGLSDQWILRFTSFKKMYKLIVRYFEDHLRKSLKDFDPTPNLQKIAKDGDESESVLLCMMVLTLATLVCPDVHVPKMQALPTWAQTALMLGIESVNSKLVPMDVSRSPLRGRPTDADPLGARRMSDSSARDAAADLAEQLRLLQIEHDSLRAEMRLLGQAHDDATHKLQMAEHDLKAAQDELQSAELGGRAADERPASAASDEDEEERQAHSRQEYLLRAELDQAKHQLDSLGAKLDLAEATHEKDVEEMAELRRRLDELADVEEQNRGLRDQLDESRHDKERARKMENVMEKYKKKLEESADLRRQMKTLEEQNSDLLDRNTALEDEYRKVAAFKPLMEQYKSQIAALEADLSARRREHDRLQYELEGARARAQQAEEEREREAEALALFEERVKELEEEEPLRGARRRRRRRSDEEGDEPGGIDASFERHVDEETGIIEGIGGELNDAIEGRTMTSLKLELRKLQREINVLRAAQDEGEEGGQNKSRYIVLENLLEDANRMKRKYEDDYLRQYRETLVLSSQLEEIRSGKSGSGDGAEASIALRQRLNETVEELEKLKAEHTELSVSYEQLTNELTLAKSDLHLVGKDQLEMLSSLRESVSTEKIGLEHELERLKQEQSLMRDQLTMKTEQIQTLLLEKIGLQSDSIDQREKLLRRQLEGAPQAEGGEGERMRVGVLEELLKGKEEECKLLKGKLEKAKLFIMNQDKLYKESIRGQAAALGSVDNSALTDGTNEGQKAEVAALKESIERLQIQHGGMEARYQRELRLMGSAWQNLGQQKLRETIALNRNDVQGHGGGGGSPRVGGAVVKGSTGFGGQLRPQSWMKVQRDRMMNQYSLKTIKIYPAPKRVPLYYTTIEEGKM